MSMTSLLVPATTQPQMEMYVALVHRQGDTTVEACTNLRSY